MNKYFCILFLILGFHFANGQYKNLNSLQYDSSIKATVMPQGKYSTMLYTVNGEPVTKTTIENLLLSYPSSSVEYKSYKKQREQTILLTILCASVSVAALVAANVQASQQPGGSTSNFNKSPYLFSLSIGSLVAILFVVKKNEHFTKAIQAYNSRF